MKKEIKSVFVLLFICVLSALMLSGVNTVTGERIKENNEKNENASLYAVFENPTGFTKLEYNGKSDTVVAIYRENSGEGYGALVSTSSQYSTSPLSFTLGISHDGKIVGVELTNYGETKTIGDYPESFIGASSALSGISVYSGATYSSMAFKSAVEEVFSVMLEMGLISEGEKSEAAKILEVITKVFPGAVDENGILRATESEPLEDGIIYSYTADNGVGIALVTEEKSKKLIYILSTSGSAMVYDIDGNVVEDVNLSIAENTPLKEILSSTAENDAKYAERMVGEGEALEKITPENSFGVVSSVYSSNEKYIFICRPFGYAKPMLLMLEIENGRVTNFKNSGELIQGGQYYEGFELNEGEYRENIIGRDDGATESLIVAGATVTGNAVKRALADAFVLYREVVDEAS